MPGTNLTRIEAEQRSGIVSDVHYRVHLDLTHGERIFHSCLLYTSPSPRD